MFIKLTTHQDKPVLVNLVNVEDIREKTGSRVGSIIDYSQADSCAEFMETLEEIEILLAEMGEMYVS